MSKVIGIGETVLDIVFENDVPVSAKPGGSVYNAMISLGRRGVKSLFVSEVGNDHIGGIIRRFLVENGVDDAGLCSFEGGKSPLALAFLDADRNAQYTFYKDYPAQRLQFAMPPIEQNDVLLFGSYFAVNKVIRDKVEPLIRTAKKSGAMLYYDVNFRASHKHELDAIMPTIIENYKYADIVKGSVEDFEIMYGTADVQRIYTEYVAPCCKLFVCTMGKDGVLLKNADGEAHIPARPIKPLSTIGAGDSFNAGFVYGLITNKITKSDLHRADVLSVIGRPAEYGVEFASEVCQSYDNYVAKQ